MVLFPVISVIYNFHWAHQGIPSDDDIEDVMTVGNFKEHLVIMDDQTWIWGLANHSLERMKLPFVRLPSSVPIRQSWNRFVGSERIIIHWEANQRSGGAIIEEILDVAPNFNVGEHVIVLTTNPTHEDVVYFSELGVRRIITIRNRDKELKQAGKELAEHCLVGYDPDKREKAWNRLLHAIDTVPETAKIEMILKFDNAVQKLKPDPMSARWLDAKASIAAIKNQPTEALRLWHAALDLNPNYFRTFNNLIKFHRQQGNYEEAMSLMKKMHALNKENISRLVDMGSIQLELKDHEKAEFYFKTALVKDSYCSGALNGLAEIRFHQGDLEQTRELLARSHLGYKAASAMNKAGIELVKKASYEDALEHYTKAQYVLPTQDKGPMLFYNIGLCYQKWGKEKMAMEFLNIALIKEPNYKKARRLMESLQVKLEPTLNSAAG
jgi:pentatricopeptide repeat protein